MLAWYFVRKRPKLSGSHCVSRLLKTSSEWDKHWSRCQVEMPDVLEYDSSGRSASSFWAFKPWPEWPPQPLHSLIQLLKTLFIEPNLSVTVCVCVCCFVVKLNRQNSWRDQQMPIINILLMANDAHC